MRRATIYGKKKDGAAILTQREAVLYHLQTGNTLTQREATRFWSVTRLPSIINLLRKQLIREGGRYRIITRDVTEKNRFGASCRFAEYRLEAIRPNDSKEVRK